jgi:DNA mismatch repair protein MutS2
LAVAERLKLPKTVLERANELLDSETRQMGDLIRDLEDQKNLVDEQVAELERRKEEMALLEIQMQDERNRLEKQLLTARRDEARRFAKILEEKEQILEDVLEKLKSDPSRKLVAKSWDDIKFVKRDALNEAENIPSVLKAKQKAAKAAEKVRAELVPLAELREKPEIKEGDTLIVCQQGSLFGREATVVKNMGRQIQVSVSGITMSLKLTDLSAVMDSGVVPTRPRTSSIQSKKARLSKAAEKALQQDISSRPSSSDDEAGKAKSKVAIRTESNTVDVRGSNFEEAKSMVKDKISRCLLNGQSFVYILHGHGTGGVLKSKVRLWLKSEQQLVKRYAPADQADGGDAFTLVEIR